MKLFEIEIKIRAVVAAIDNRDALSVAVSEARDIMLNDPLDDIDVAREITSIGQLPAGWSATCNPFGKHGDRSTAEFLANPPADPTPDTKTFDMFAEAAP